MNPGTELPTEFSWRNGMEVHARAAAQLLKALANEHRLLILCRLVEGEHSVGELHAEVSLSQSALSQHLSVLRRDGLVDTRREAQTVFYRLAAGPARDVIRALHEAFCCADVNENRSDT